MTEKRKTLNLSLTFNKNCIDFRNKENVFICSHTLLLLWNVPPTTKKIWLSITDQPMRGYESVLIKYSVLEKYPRLTYFDVGGEQRPIDLTEWKKSTNHDDFEFCCFGVAFDRAIGSKFGPGSSGELKVFYVRIQV